MNKQNNLLDRQKNFLLSAVSLALSVGFMYKFYKDQVTGDTTRPYLNLIFAIVFLIFFIIRIVRFFRHPLNKQ
jgi:hypothetical protein